MEKIATAKRSGRSRDIELRDSHWPDAPERVWDRTKHDGFATVPKTLPIIMRALDEMSKGKPLGATYFALWCSTWDNGFVRLGRAPELAYASGFTGARGVRAWQERMKLLEALGFVDIRPSSGQRFGLAFLPNPNVVLLELWDRKRKAAGKALSPEGMSGLQDETISLLYERALDIGANDALKVYRRLTAPKDELDNEPSPKKPRRTRATKTATT